MVAIILIGYAFRQLAFDRKRNEWLWVILSIVTYFLAQVLIGLIIALIKPDMLKNEMGINILGWIGGLLATFVLYMYLKNLPEKEDKILDNNDLLDDNFKTGA